MELLETIPDSFDSDVLDAEVELSSDELLKGSELLEGSTELEGASLLLWYREELPRDVPELDAKDADDGALDVVEEKTRELLMGALLATTLA